MNSSVQDRKPDTFLPLSRVGVKGLKFPVTIKRENREIFLSATAEVFVDVPAERKGADLSEINKAVSTVVLKGRDFEGIENITAEICSSIMDRLPYVGKCECRMEADYFVKSTVTGGTALSNSSIIGETRLFRNAQELDFIGISVQGINACPCTMEKERTILKEKYPEYSAAIETLPMITHNQRNHVLIMVQKTRNRFVDADTLLKVAEEVVGRPASIGTGSENDADLILRQHLNPMFVEDVVREVARKLKTVLSDLDPETMILVQSESEESVHAHNAFAEFSGKFKEI